MRNVLTGLSLLFLGQIYLAGQNVIEIDSIFKLLGTDHVQEVSSEDVERLEYLLYHPARINQLDEAGLRSTGLFSQYQVAVIKDYLSLHGNIMSLMELSLLDGFDSDLVKRLAPFISLAPSGHEEAGCSHETAVRAGGKWQEGKETDGSYGAKYRININDGLKAVCALSRAAATDSWAPSAYTGSLEWKLRRCPVRIIAGDFNARFGQGLVLWNNSFMNTLTSPDTFMKKPSGITQSWSFTGSSSLRGLATEIGFGSFQLTALASHSGPALNLAWYGRNGQISITNILWKSGIDAAFCIKGVNVFGEASYDWDSGLPSCIAGTRFRISESVDVAAQTRVFVKEEYGLALGGSLSFGQNVSAVMTADAAYYPVPKDKNEIHSAQLKTQMVCEMQSGTGWKLKLRVSERLRTWGLCFRTDIRADVLYDVGPIVLTTRVNVLSCDKTGVLSYVEGGYRQEKLSCYLRQGIFFIDDWDDRIYVYERDAPGSFNVPAMYGRGVWTAITANLKFARSLSLYARASYVAYPFMEKKKPGKAELKLQLQYRF